MAAANIDGIKLKEAIDQFGSLQKAIENFESKKEALGNEVSQLKKDEDQLKVAKDKLATDIENLGVQFVEEKTKLELLASNFGQWQRQYNLFQSFIAMLLSSPSVNRSLKSLISFLKELAESGWVMTKTLDDLRGYFVSTIMGDYLKCFRCDSCGAQFIVNKEHQNEFYGNQYYCPACHFSLGVKPDDSFIKAMVSEEQMGNIVLVEKTLKEAKVLEPLKAFLEVPCEICGEPVKEWDNQNVKLAIDGFGYGHTRCWSGELGQLRQLRKFLEKERKEKKNPN